MAKCMIKDRLDKETERRLLDDLESMRNSLRWFYANKEKLKEKYENQFVGIYDCVVVEYDKNPIVMLDRIRKSFPEKENRIIIECVRDYNLLLASVDSVAVDVLE